MGNRRRVRTRLTEPLMIQKITEGFCFWQDSFNTIHRKNIKLASSENERRSLTTIIIIQYQSVSLFYFELLLFTRVQLAPQYYLLIGLENVVERSRLRSTTWTRNHISS